VKQLLQVYHKTGKMEEKKALNNCEFAKDRKILRREYFALKKGKGNPRRKTAAGVFFIGKEGIDWD